MHKPAFRKILVLLIVVGLIVAVVLGGILWIKRHDLQRSLERASLPEESTYHPLPTSTTNSSPIISHKPIATPVPAKKLLAEANLAIPFTVQAPHAKWEPPYKEFCEEASVLMAMSYLTGQDIVSPEFADRELLEIKAFEDKKFGYYEDTTAEETATIIREYYGFDKVTLKENPSVDDIKQAISRGQAVIVPAAGRLLGNPHFQQPGPLYHMLVIKGYASDGKFIVNDPGTRHGADFLYEEGVLMNAMHDWRSDGQVEQGRKVIIIVG